MEGREIAVWVHSNLDRVELFHNGQSLGAKDVKKDSHLEWIVKHAPGVIEARGYKDGKLLLTAKRETTGSATKLVMRADRTQVSADGEDVTMLAVEIHDAQGRVVPVTDHDVTFRVSGQGRLIGTGNGDPTNQEPDKGNSRKAFSGLCAAIVQSTKSAGNITVEATSPGLTPATVTVAAKTIRLRPQVVVWEREVPTGPGITGLWRPTPVASMAAEPQFGSGASSVFTLRQDGNEITGTVEGPGAGRVGFGSSVDAAAPIEAGQVDGDRVSFKAGNSTYRGRLNGDQLELQRSSDFGGRGGPTAAPSGPRPAIGPPPDGSDPSRGPGGRRAQSPGPLILRRANR
jgi:beta-galactosidase